MYSWVYGVLVYQMIFNLNPLGTDKIIVLENLRTNKFSNLNYVLNNLKQKNSYNGLMLIDLILIEIKLKNDKIIDYKFLTSYVELIKNLLESCLNFDPSKRKTLNEIEKIFEKDNAKIITNEIFTENLNIKNEENLNKNNEKEIEKNLNEDLAPEIFKHKLNLIQVNENEENKLNELNESFEDFNNNKNINLKEQHNSSDILVEINQDRIFVDVNEMILPDTLNMTNILEEEVIYNSELNLNQSIYIETAQDFQKCTIFSLNESTLNSDVMECNNYSKK